MKQRKLLELNSKVSLEAVVGETLELYFRMGSKTARIANEEITELYKWLGNDILGGSSSFREVHEVNPEPRLQIKEPPARPAGMIPATPMVFDPALAAKAFSKENIFNGGQNS